MPELIQELPDGPLDIIGDVHGEVDALDALLERLGVDWRRGTASRPVVFVGDLVDRGPDSVAVVERVSRLWEAGLASCVLGNHELNLLRGGAREGNGWFLGHEDTWQPHVVEEGGVARIPFESRAATSSERDWILAFFRELPLLLRGDGLVVAHACWRPDVEAMLQSHEDVLTAYAAFADRTVEVLEREGTRSRARAQRAAWSGLTSRADEPTEFLDAVARDDAYTQNSHPVRLITSGPEQEVGPGGHYFAGGKWRFVRRQRWWDTYEHDTNVIVGHYWRDRAGSSKPWREPPFAWGGPRRNVMCIDYSVGRRFMERADKSTGFAHGLAALRWPERTLVFDDHAETVSTVTRGRLV